jgi:hypothetical protein
MSGNFSGFELPSEWAMNPQKFSPRKPVNCDSSKFRSPEASPDPYSPSSAWYRWTQADLNEVACGYGWVC